MMPWEHVLVGYISYSLFVYAVYRDTPTSKESLVVIFASLLPDIIDKPLAWEFGVFASGHALAHSIFVATPVSIVVGWLASSRGRPRIGWAFAIGYLLHLLADVIPQYLFDGEVKLHRILWPIRREEGGRDTNFRDEFMDNVVEYTLWLSEQVTSGDPDPYLFVFFGLGGLGVLLWIYDGMPVVREVYHVPQRIVSPIALSSTDELRKTRRQMYFVKYCETTSRPLKEASFISTFCRRFLTSVMGPSISCSGVIQEISGQWYASNGPWEYAQVISHNQTRTAVSVQRLIGRFVSPVHDTLEIGENMIWRIDV